MTKLEARCAGLVPLTSPYAASECEAMEQEFCRLLTSGAEPVLVAVAGGMEIWRKPVKERKQRLARLDYHMLRKNK